MSYNIKLNKNIYKHILLKSIYKTDTKIKYKDITMVIESLNGGKTKVVLLSILNKQKSIVNKKTLEYVNVKYGKGTLFTNCKVTLTEFTIKITLRTVTCSLEITKDSNGNIISKSSIVEHDDWNSIEEYGVLRTISGELSNDVVQIVINNFNKLDHLNVPEVTHMTNPRNSYRQDSMFDNVNHMQVHPRRPGYTPRGNTITPHHPGMRGNDMPKFPNPFYMPDNMYSDSIHAHKSIMINEPSRLDKLIIILEHVAIGQRLITYKTLCTLLNTFRFGDGEDVIEPNSLELRELLSKASEYSYSQCKILLSCVVVNGEDKTPGKGFYKLAREYGNQEKDDTTLSTEELRKVFAEYLTKHGVKLYRSKIRNTSIVVQILGTLESVTGLTGE